MIDLALLRLIKDKETFDKVHRYIPKHGVDKRTKILVNDVAKYFEANPEETKLDFDAFRSMFFTMWHKNMSEGEVDYFNAILTRMVEDVSDTVKKNMINNLLELGFATDAANVIQDYDQGEDIDLLLTIGNLYNNVKDTLERTSKFDFAGLDDVIHEDTDDTGLLWPLDCMNEVYRNILGGDQYIIAARPGKGKTSFLTFLNWSLVKQMPKNKVIVWFNNESTRNRIISRQIMSALNANSNEIRDFKEQNVLSEKYIDAMGSADRVRVYDIHGKNNFHLEEILESIGIDNVGAVITDMLDNVKFPSHRDMREDQRLEQLYQWHRELGVKYNCPMFPTSQISNEGAGLMFPTENMLKDSKCLVKDTPVRMLDGSIKLVQDVQIGDQLLGIDSTPRNVVAKANGEEELFEISGQGWSFGCNKSHILTVVKATSKPMNGHYKNQLVDLPLQYFLDNPSRLLHYKAVRVRAFYEEANLPLDPYTFGLWLGDGNSRDFNITTADQVIANFLAKHKYYNGYYEQPVKTGNKRLVDIRLCGENGGRAKLRELGVFENKHIPAIYKHSSVEQRLQLLAGIMDSDGYVDSGSSAVTMAREGLINDIAEVARSLGYRVSQRGKTTNFNTMCYTVQFANTEKLPTLLHRKTTVCKVRQDTMTIKSLGHGEYFGFSVDGDNRYVLGNYIATHNTGKQGACDGIIMIGSSDDQLLQNKRGLSMPKTKSKRAGQSDLYQEITFDSDRGRFRE